MSDVFELIKADDNLVVVKVKEVDNLTIALNPYIDSNYDYITVSKGKGSHVLTVIKKDGTHGASFSWGTSTTLISEGLELLKEKVRNFIKEEANITV